MKGQHHTELAKTKISKTTKGVSKPFNSHPLSEKHKDKLRESHKGQIPWNKGKYGIYSEAHIQKLRKSHIGLFLGEKSPNWGKFGGKNANWKGGKSFEPYTREFANELKELIRYRDGYKCQKCGCSELENAEKLSIHHVDYNKKNCKPSNLISLCRGCNSKVNSNRNKWTRYFRKKIKKIMDSNHLQLHFRTAFSANQVLAEYLFCKWRN